MAYSDIKDPSAHFQTLVFTGTGGLNLPVTHTNTGNSDLQPDLIWFKDRGAGYSHYVVDSSRGRDKGLYPDGVNAEVSSSANDDLVSFDTDGFKVGAPSNANSTNGGTTSKVAWQWKANGGTTASNTSGSITSTVQANTDAGFSIITYTGTGGGETFGHGLGVAPDMWIVKRRSGTGSWAVGFNNSDILGGTSKYLILQGTGATSTYSNFWGSSPASSTVMRIAGDATIGGSGSTYVAYAFAEKQGYSKFGKYIGNGSNTDGTFIYTGFKPAMIIAKRTDASAHNWFIWDTKRAPSNMVQAVLYPNATSSEGTLFQIDILSNGFKHYNNYGSTNVSGGTFIYMAFAENPFVTSTGTPTTAR